MKRNGMGAAWDGFGMVLGAVAVLATGGCGSSGSSSNDDELDAGGMMMAGDAGPGDDDDDVDDDAGTPDGPMASFETRGDLVAGAPVTFDASGSDGDALDYVWSFPEGEAGGAETVRVFSEEGLVDVALTVVDGDGREDTATRTLTIASGPEPTGEADVAVRILDAGGDPVAEARVRVDGEDAGMTDVDGRIEIPGVDAGVAVVVTVDAPGFARQVLRTELPADWVEAIPLAIRLLERATGITVENIEDGADVEGSRGVRLTIPPGAIVDQDGEPIGGTVDIFLTPVDVAEGVGREAFPGAFAGVGPTTGGIRPIASLGTVECVIVPRGGGTARIRPGAQVTLDVPIATPAVSPDALVATGESQPAWSLDELTGLWVREGSGTVVTAPAAPSGLALRVRTPSARWWNVDVPFRNPWRPQVRCTGPGGGATRCLARASTPRDVTVDDVPTAVSAFRSVSALSADGRTLDFPDDRALSFDVVSSDGTLGARLDAQGNAAEGPEELVLALAPLDPGGEGTVLEPPATAEGSLEGAGDRDRFLVDVGADETLLIRSARTAGGLSANVRIYEEGGLLLREGTLGSCADLGLLADEATRLAVVIEATAGSGSYALTALTGPTIGLDTELDGQRLEGPVPQQVYGFGAAAEDQINVAFETTEGAPSASIQISVVDLTTCRVIARRSSAAAYGETDLFVAESTGDHVAILSRNFGEDVDYRLGLSDVDPPEMLEPTDPFTVETAEITVIGKRDAWRVPVVAGDEITYSIDIRVDEVPDGTEAIAAYARLYGPSDDSLIPRRPFLSDISVYRVPGSTIARPVYRSNHIVAEATGDLSLLIVPTRLSERGVHEGIYEVAAAKPDADSLTPGTTLSGTLNNYVEWRRFSFVEDGTASALLFRTTRNHSQYIYQCLYDDTRTLLAGPRSLGLSGGTPSVEIASEDIVGSGETYEIQIEPTSGCTDGGRVFWSDPIEYTQTVIALAAPRDVTPAASPGTTYAGDIDVAGDREYFRVSLAAGETLTIEMAEPDDLTGRFHLYEEPTDFTARPSALNRFFDPDRAASLAFAATESITVLVEVDGQEASTGAYDLTLSVD